MMIVTVLMKRMMMVDMPLIFSMYRVLPGCDNPAVFSCTLHSMQVDHMHSLSGFICGDFCCGHAAQLQHVLDTAWL